MTRKVRSTVARHRYVRGVTGLRGKLWDALHYMQCRPLGEDEQAADRILFTSRTEGLSRQEARALILEHAGRRVAYHRLILSPGESVEDMRRWTRLVLADLSRHLHQDLHWVAVVHRNTAHPHVHVLVAGRGERLSGEGRAAAVLLRPDEYEVLRESGDHHGRDLARAECSLDEAIRTELDREMTGLLRTLADALADEGIQTHKHLLGQGERRGPPGRDATRGR